MSAVRRNVLANFAFQAWAAVIGFILVPIYVRLLGIETYGLIAFFVTLQALAGLLDLGIASSLSRELAIRSINDRLSMRTLLRTLEAIYLPIGVALGLALWFASGWIALTWLKPVDLTRDDTGTAIGLMGLVLALQWPTGLYAAGLIGLQRQVLSNFLGAVFATLRSAGVVAAMLWFGPTLKVFFLWHAGVMAIQTVAHGAVLWHLLPAAEMPVRTHFAELRRMRRFAAGVGALGVLSFLLMQIDKIMLSRMAPLDQLGVYSLAAAVATVYGRVFYSWYFALYPRFSELHARGDGAALSASYHAGNQWVAVTAIPPAVVAALFAEPLLILWTSDTATSAQAAPILAVLIYGTALNGLMSLPYALQLASGWTSLTLRVNIVSVLVLIPSIVWLIDHFGPVGAATAWLVLNAGYVVVIIPLLHRRLLRHEMWAWYLNDIGPAVLTSALVAGLAKALLPVPQDAAATVLIVGIALGATCGAAALATAGPRRWILGHLRFFG